MKTQTFSGAIIFDLSGRDQLRIGNIQVVKILRDLKRVLHRSAHNGNFAAVCRSQVGGNPQAMNRRGKAAEKKPLFCARKYFVQRGANGAFAGCVAMSIDIGGILQEGKDATFSIFGESVQLKGWPSGGVRSILKSPEWITTPAGVSIASATQSTRLCVTRIGVILKMPRENGSLGTISTISDIVEQAMLFQLALNVCQGKLCAVDGHTEFRQNPRQATDVVFMPVRQHDAAHALAVLNQIGDVGHDDVDTEQFFVGKHQAGIDDKNVILPANCHAILAEFAEATKGDNL